LQDFALTGRAQFTTSRLLLWTLYSAIFVSIFSVFPATRLAFSVATFVAVIFVALDVKFNGHFRGWLGISFFSCALAYVVTVGFFTMQLYPPTVPPKPPLPFWSGLYHLVSGGFIREIAQEIATAIAMTIYYLMTIMACTLASTTIALFTLKRNRKSRWLLAMNAPGILLTLYCVSAHSFTMNCSPGSVESDAQLRDTPEPCHAPEWRWPAFFEIKFYSRHPVIPSVRLLVAGASYARCRPTLASN
jgi:hypothetical protein